MEPAITLSQKQSNAWHYLEDKVTNEILYGGAAGGGKSILGCIWHVTRRMTYKNTRGLIGRATLKSLGESTLITLFEVCRLMGYVAGRDYKYNQQKNIIVWKNGSRTILMDLEYKPGDPDFQRMGSTEYTDAFVDEAAEISLKAYEIINSRIRWKLKENGLVAKILMTCNPGYNWVRDTFIRDKDNNDIILKPYQRFVSALVTDNPDKAFAAAYMEQLNRMSSDYDKARLLRGDWDATEKTGAEFYKHFTGANQIRRLKYNPDLPLHLTFDFNVQPYVSLGIWQVWGKTAYQVDEIAATSPDNSTPGACRLFKKKYANHSGGVFFYGDPAGKHEDTRSDKRVTKGKNDFSIIEKHLKEYNPKRRVSMSAPSVSQRGNFINEIFEKGYNGIKIYIGEICVKSIEDFLKVKEAADGTKQKKRITDPKTKASYEKYGHFSDSADYLLITIFKKDYIEYITPRNKPTASTGRREYKKHVGY